MLSCIAEPLHPGSRLKGTKPARVPNHSLADGYGNNFVSELLGAPRGQGVERGAGGTRPARRSRARVSPTEAQVHGVAQGGQGPPLPQGTHGRTQPQRRLLLLPRQDAPLPPRLPLPIGLIHMDGEGLILMLLLLQPRRRSMALAAAPRCLWEERPSAPGP